MKEDEGQEHSLRAAGETPVTQRYYARRGVITPEMEFVAIRENLGREQVFKAIYDRYPNAKSRPDEVAEALETLTMMPRPSELEAQEGFGPSSMVARDRLDHQHAPERRKGCRMPLARRNKKILFVGCKRQAQEAVREAAEATGQYYVNHRWLGGMLTNMSTIRKSIERLVYLEGIEKSPEFKSMSKKELAALDRERQKLERNLQGIRNMGGAPDAMVAIGADHEDIAIREAHRLNIPVCVLVDTNADPKEIDFPIPGNDDAVRSIRLILDCIVKAINEGKGASAEA